MTKIGSLLCVSAIAVSASGLALNWPLQADRHSSNEVYPVRFTLPPLQPHVVARLGPVAWDERNAEQQLLVSPAPSPAVEDLPVEPPVREAVVFSSDDVVDLKFDLADYSGLSSDRITTPAIEIRKPLVIDGAAVGDAQISILSGSRLAISGSEFGRLLTAAGKATARGGGLGASENLYTFDELRDLGFEIRYDPVADRIQLST